MRLFLVSVLFITSLFAELKVGDSFPQITLPDQFDNNLSVSKEDKYILMTFEKDISVEIKDFLMTKEKGFLENNNVKFVSDISSMPGFVTTMFALPKMRKYPFSVMLIYDEDEGKRFNAQEERITLYKLDNMKITDIKYVTSAELNANLPK